MADYKLGPINLAEEQALIQGATAGFGDELLDLTILESPITLPKLAEALTQGVDLLHIVAHGMFSQRRSAASLFLADEQNQVALIDDQALANMISHLTNLPRLIFLASCQTAAQSSSKTFRGLGPRLIAAGCRRSWPCKIR